MTNSSMIMNKIYRCFLSKHPEELKSIITSVVLNKFKILDEDINEVVDKLFIITKAVIAGPYTGSQLHFDLFPAAMLCQNISESSEDEISDHLNERIKEVNATISDLNKFIKYVAEGKKNSDYTLKNTGPLKFKYRTLNDSYWSYDIINAAGSHIGVGNNDLKVIERELKKYLKELTTAKDYVDTVMNEGMKK